MANNVHHSGNRPSLLITRAREDAVAFVAELPKEVIAQTDILIAPLLRIEGSGVLPDLAGVQGVIFTSAKGVESAPPGAGREAHCVGEKTAQAARAQGWKVCLTAQTAEELLARITATGPLVHLAGHHQRGDIADILTVRGTPCQRHVVYQQHLEPLSAAAHRMLEGDKPVVVPLFSPRTAGQFAAQARSVAQVHVLAISTAAAEALGACTPATVHIAAAPTGIEMRRGVEKLLYQASLP
ncbi:uroporphyrinogen-III synthase [Sulfitobacter sp. JB4-11]|uniref:uroporphyrinogen-III synthase n=1 Tax=Sulfitobacter rhodophyticola TaxID=3238304 RepID=UPI003D81807D